MDSANKPQLAKGVKCSAEVTKSREFKRPMIPPPSVLARAVSGSAEVTKSREFKMPIIPPPVYIPIGGPASSTTATQSQSISGDKIPLQDLPRGRIPCLRCKENRIDCHGPETEYYGDCSKCHEAGKRCEFEAHVLDTPSSLPIPQSSAINDAMPHPTASTSNENGKHINIPDPQSDKSSGRQNNQKSPVIDESRDREIFNTIGGIPSNNSISDVPRIKPWWKRMSSKLFSSR